MGFVFTRFLANFLITITLVIFLSVYLNKTKKSLQNPPFPCDSFAIKVKNPYTVVQIIAIVSMVVAVLGSIVNAFVP